MRLGLPQAIIVVTGLLLIVAGGIALEVQLYRAITRSGPLTATLSLAFNKDEGPLDILTDHPGLMMITAGAFLQIVGLGASYAGRAG